MIPRLTVMAPKDAEFRNMLQFALDFTEDPSQSGILGSVPTNNMPSSPVVFGKSELLIRHKTAKVAVVAIGSMVSSYEVIVTQNLPVKLINVRFAYLDHAELRQSWQGVRLSFPLKRALSREAFIVLWLN